MGDFNNPTCASRVHTCRLPRDIKSVAVPRQDSMSPVRPLQHMYVCMVFLPEDEVEEEATVDLLVSK